MKSIKKRILMVLILLIFFMSLGSAVASSDNDLSDLSSDISLDSDILQDKSEDSQSFSINDDSAVSNDELIESKESNNDSIIKEDSNAVDSTDDSSKINDIIVTKSQSSSRLLSSPQTIVIKDASCYDGSINEYIQNLIDDAAAGSTIQFTGSSYENIYLKISKPLNIISKSGTVINNIFNIPVFTILQGGSGTNISGFTANLVGSFVEASDVSDIGISKNKISTKRNAIVLNEVYDSFIKNNLFSNFKIAMDISNSGGIAISKNNITPKDGNNIGINLKEIKSKKGISITDNNITASDRRKEGTAIYFDKNACNVFVKGNTIRGWYTAINFPYSINNVTIINNTISDNGDGVIINGYINDFTFNKNIVTGNGRNGVLFDYDFMRVNSGFTLENNFFSSNGGLDLKNQGDQAVSIGKNFAKNRCYRVGMKYGFNIISRQNGSKYYFSVVDRYGKAVSDLPNFSAVLTVNGRQYTVNFINSVAYIDVGSYSSGNGDSSSLNIGEDNRNFGQWGQYREINSQDMDYYESVYKDLLDSIMDSIDSKDDSRNSSNNDQNYDSGHNTYNNSGSSQNSGTGTGDSGVSAGSNSINSNGVLSGSSGSSDASIDSASPSSASPSPSSNVPESTSVKTLSVDEETFRVIGVGGLVLLIILVIGLYYREDIKDMMNE